MQHTSTVAVYYFGMNTDRLYKTSGW